MIKLLHTRRRGFTFIEIMIVVAIIALLVAASFPAFVRARKRSQATLVLEDLRTLDHALEQYAIDANAPADTPVVFADLQKYVNPGSTLHATGADIFGNPYGPFQVSHFPDVPPDTFVALADVVDSNFWAPYN